MIFKHSLKSIIRTPIKTLLFLFLLMLLTILLSIGSGMFTSAQNMLVDADQTFSSVVELKYLGDTEKDDSFFHKMNENLKGFDLERIMNHEAVKSVNIENQAWAYLEGDVVKRFNTPLNNYVMLTIGSIGYNNVNQYQGVVSEVFFGKKARPDAYIIINDMDAQGNPISYDFERDHEYLVIGEVGIGRVRTYVINPSIPEPAKDLPYIIDLTENPDFFDTEEGKKVLSLRDSMIVVDDSFQVTTVTSLEASASYYFNELLIREGRIFTSTEYQRGNEDVIMISEALADFYQVKVGDKLPLNLHYNPDGLGRSDYVDDHTYDYQAEYEIVGIYENKEENKHTIFMPKPSWLQQEWCTNTVARFIVQNGRGEEFIQDIQSDLLENMICSLYDQGYGEAVKPILALRNSALIIIILGILSGIAILTLFSYLFVFKQSVTVRTMLALGTGRRRTRNYILYGALGLVISAFILGALIASLLLHRVTKLIFEAMLRTYGSDLRFSERAIGLQMSFVPEVRVNPLLPVVIVIVIFILSLLPLITFTNKIMKEEVKERSNKTRKTKKTKIKRIKAKKVLFGSVRPLTLKFALTSLTRSPGRSLIIPIVTLTLSSFLVFLSLLSNKQQEELSTVYERIPVNAYLTSNKNETRDVGGLNLQKDIYRMISPEYGNEPDQVTSTYTEWSIVNEPVLEIELHSSYPWAEIKQKERELVLSESEYYERMYLYNPMHYEYMGVSKTKDGEVNPEIAAFPEIRYHKNAYGFDWFLHKVKQMPTLAYADDIRYTPDFFNIVDPEVEFLEGYDHSSLSLLENVGMISKSFAAANGITMGDTIRVTAWSKYVIFWEEVAVCSLIDIKVVGIYDLKWSTDTIYLPWVMGYSHDYYVDYQYPIDDSATAVHYSGGINEDLISSIRAVTFTLKNTKELTIFRDSLEAAGYSQVGKVRDNRRVVVIEDKQLMETIQNLTNHIRLINIIKPIMLVLFGIIGFIISYLLMKHRVNELAIMRSLGSKKKQVFLSFFLEQFVLFLFGLCPALILAIVQPDKGELFLVSLLFFTICYIAGTAIALAIMNRAKIMDILFTKE